MELMRTHYLDASAIVKLFVAEQGSNAIRAYFDKEENFYITNLCFVEALTALKVKYKYRKEISDEEYFSACDHLFAYAGKGVKIEIENIEIRDRMVFAEVEKLARKYKIDVSNAFQIVSIKKNYFSRFTSDSKPILITGDQALATAACKEGIRVWDCVNEPEPNDV
jgi:predicted nucleic acid-binding protein